MDFDTLYFLEEDGFLEPLDTDQLYDIAFADPEPTQEEQSQPIIVRQKRRHPENRYKNINTDNSAVLSEYAAGVKQVINYEGLASGIIIIRACDYEVISRKMNSYDTKAKALIVHPSPEFTNDINNFIIETQRVLSKQF